jgi:hypothetical protein
MLDSVYLETVDIEFVNAKLLDVEETDKRRRTL